MFSQVESLQLPIPPLPEPKQDRDGEAEGDKGKGDYGNDDVHRGMRGQHVF